MRVPRSLARVRDTAALLAGRAAGRSLSAREELGARYLRGTGLEIGALHHPLRVPAWVDVRYVDRMDTPALRRHYPELRALPLVEVDVVDDAERLRTVGARSVGFVIAHHVLEHCEDPIGALGNWLRVVRVGGVVLLSVPDLRLSFDATRAPTPLAHLVRDHEEGPIASRAEHFLEWARHVERLEGEAAIERARHLESVGYSIHFHAWTYAEFVELLLHCRTRRGVAFEIEAVQRDGLEVVAVLRKSLDTGP